MAFNPDIHHRHSIRLRDYDYSSNGAYFLSLCTRERKCVFGEIIDGSMHLNEVGCLVEACWRAIAENFPDVKLDLWVIMPNHLHGIIIITDALQPVGAYLLCPPHASTSQTTYQKSIYINPDMAQTQVL